MTIHFPNHAITIYRNRRKGTTNRFSMSATYTAYSADIQPTGMTRQQQATDRWSSTYRAFVDSNDGIKEGDQIHTEDGKIYSVKGVNRWDGGGGFADLDHIELMLTSLDG